VLLEGCWLRRATGHNEGPPALRERRCRDMLQGASSSRAGCSECNSGRMLAPAAKMLDGPARGRGVHSPAAVRWCHRATEEAPREISASNPAPYSCLRPKCCSLPPHPPAPSVPALHPPSQHEKARLDAGSRAFRKLQKRLKEDEMRAFRGDENVGDAEELAGGSRASSAARGVGR
jgi:hypothetical protein